MWAKRAHFWVIRFWVSIRSCATSWGPTPAASSRIIQNEAESFFSIRLDAIRFVAHTTLTMTTTTNRTHAVTDLMIRTLQADLATLIERAVLAPSRLQEARIAAVRSEIEEVRAGR